ncbi:two-component system sensor histidine kinase NtrB [Natrinema longum]|uniref:histidine kinase n=1 Tax=Natrinema longum TaxID=370324 RepID=A0A8A2U895_9EURY|nr:PAS domain-containing sensor histidine kinase [Natrinema longum]MBZ6494509.1 PAS domain-containing sensor histidine kinase [Natrinema longum]QSW84168.1 PAS domain-containing sensor histidine kinase [Natrinema longum]
MDSHTLPVSSAEFYRTLVENAAEGMLTIDEDSRIVYANPAIEDILGYTPDELVGSTKMKIIPERLRPVHAGALESYVQTGDRNIDWSGVELPALHKDGHEVPTLISLREHEHDGERYFTGIVRDITERREREDEIHEQKERLDQFAEILAHDIRNPLSVAQGYTDVAKQTYDAPVLADISDALDHIDELVDDVLVLSKTGQTVGELGPCSVEHGVRESWQAVETRHAELRIETPIGTIRADESRFRELLGNLFRNAVEHAGADVIVRVGRLPDRDGIYIADDGPGVPDSVRSDIFEHGYSTREAGTGYGLSIVKQIAEGHGWDVSVTESEHGGARFDIHDIDFVDG